MTTKTMTKDDLAGLTAGDLRLLLETARTMDRLNRLNEPGRAAQFNADLLAAMAGDGPVHERLTAVLQAARDPDRAGQAAGMATN